MDLTSGAVWTGSDGWCRLVRELMSSKFNPRVGRLSFRLPRKVCSCLELGPLEDRAVILRPNMPPESEDNYGALLPEPNSHVEFRPKICSYFRNPSGHCGKLRAS
jgi:hypothetical protein